MKISDRVASFLEKSVLTAKGMAKILLQSRQTGLKAEQRDGRRLIIMGNGPSLADTIREHKDALSSSDTMAVNFAANAPEFFELRPQYYILADPHFFQSTDENVIKLKKNLSLVDWAMTLLIPIGATWDNREIAPSVKICRFNAVGVEGFDFFTRKVYRSGLAMPRPRNVLIPAIMIALREGFSKVMLAGADHTWTRTLSVDDQNRVVTVQPHFYEDNREEHARVASVYRDVHLHNVLESLTIAFRSYHQIAEYARKRGVDVINITPGSFIDAFPRRQL